MHDNEIEQLQNMNRNSEKEKISSSTLSYMQTRNRMRVFSLVYEEFKKSGLTKEELAGRIGKDVDHISFLLGAPGNWTLDTVSDLLLAISDAEINYKIVYPLYEKPQNSKPST